MYGAIETEPERYIAEKPYDLTKFEFSVLCRRSSAGFLFALVAGATAGIAITIAGKVLAALLEKKPPTVEAWEIWAVVIGLALSLALKLIRSKDDNERATLEEVISGHYAQNRPRRLHVTGSAEKL